MEVLGKALRLLTTGDSEVYFLAFSTARFAIISVLISSAIGIPIGLLLAFGSFPGRKALSIIFNAAMAVPTVVIGLFVYSLFARTGVFGRAPILFTPVAVVVGQALFAIPVVVSLTTSGLDRIDRRFGETLFTLGIVGYRRYLFGFREAADEIFHAVLASFGRVVGEVGISMMLGGNIRWYTRTLTTAIVLETGKGNFEFAMALGAILLGIAVIINAIVQIIAERIRSGKHD